MCFSSMYNLSCLVAGWGGTVPPLMLMNMMLLQPGPLLRGVWALLLDTMGAERISLSYMLRADSALVASRVVEKRHPNATTTTTPRLKRGWNMHEHVHKAEWRCRAGKGLPRLHGAPKWGRRQRHAGLAWPAA